MNLNDNITHIRTINGIQIDVANPTPEMFDIFDIAHGLARVCRFGGQIDDFFNVAQHSINVAKRVPAQHQLAALLHDAPEFIMGDMPRPLKLLMPDYKRVENKIMEAIAERFKIQFPFHPVIKEVDIEMLEYENRNLITGPRDNEFIVMPFAVARREFLKMFHHLANRRQHGGFELKDNYKPKIK